MPVVQETVYDAAHRVARDIQIDILLIASEAADGQAAGYGTSPTTIHGRWRTWTDQDGQWSADLLANSAIMPANTYYTLIRKGKGVRSEEALLVPNGAGPYWVDEVVTMPPTALPAFLSDSVALALASVGLAGTGNKVSREDHVHPTMGLVTAVRPQDHGAVADGVTDDRNATNTAATAAANRTLWFPSGTYLIGSNLTIPATVTVAFANGAKLAIPDGVTVTFGSPVNAPISQIFACTGTGKVVFSGRILDIYPEWWGAVGGTTADDWAPIQAAIVAHCGPQGGAGSGFTYTAQGRVLFTADSHRVTQSLVARSVYGLRLESANGSLMTRIDGSAIPAAQPGVTRTGGYILRLEGCYRPQIKNLYLRGDAAVGGIKMDGLPAIARPSQVITPVAGAGSPANFGGGTTYYLWMTHVTGSNGETQPQVTAASYVMPGSPNPIQVNLATALISFIGVRQVRFYLSTTNDPTTARYVKQSTLDDIDTVTGIVTILDPTPIAHPVSGSSSQAPPTSALTGGLVTTAGILEMIVVEGPFGAGAHALDIGSDRFQADQMSYRNCKFDGGTAKNSGDLIFIHDANAVLHNFKDCLVQFSGGKGIAVGGTGGSFNADGCGFLANTDWDWEATASTSRGIDISGCWSETSTRFGHVYAGESSVLSVCVNNGSVNVLSDSQQRLFLVEGNGRLVLNGGNYKSGQGGLPGKISMGASTSKRAGVICNGVHFDGNPVVAADLDHGAIQLNDCVIQSTVDGTIANPTSGFVPKGSIAVPLVYTTDLHYAACAWLKIASGTVLVGGSNTFAGVSALCKGLTNVQIDSITSLGGLTTQAPLIAAKDAGSGVFTITVLLATGFTLISDLVFRVSFHPE